jgi:hypothetical protein
MGDRRLKTATLLLEWIPQLLQLQCQAQLLQCIAALVGSGHAQSPTEAAAKAMQLMASQPAEAEHGTAEECFVQTLGKGVGGAAFVNGR